ncbi:MAG: CHASE3 domain-containing protein [Chitinophagaceae bacterium]|nr:CHASE3 domain-containing protein [Rubrivivax sp.]
MPLSITLGAVRKSRFVLPLVLAMAVTFLIVNEAGYRRAMSSSSTNDEVLASREEVHRLRLLVLDAESGQRGYLLTGRADFREPLEAARTAVQAQLDAIRKLYADQPARAAQMQQIEELTLQKMSEMETTVMLFDTGRGAAAQDLVRAGLGLEFMRSLDQVLAAMAQQDQLRLQVNRNALRDTLRLNRIGIAALVVLSLMWLALYLRQARSLDEERVRQARDLQAQRDQLEHEVVRRTRDLTEIATHLQTVREDERSRLARELHDELGGLLTAAKLDLARVKSRLREAGPEITERISHLSTTLDAGIALKRRIIEDLRPSTLSNLGLKATLEVLCREFARRSELAVEATVQELPLSDAVQLSAYRLVQESLTNVAKYARAASVQVAMRRDGEHAVLSVVDDGIGFDMAKVSLAARGLAGMRFRVQSGGGTLHIQSAPGEGTAVTARLPLVLQLGAAPADGPAHTPSLH